MKYLTYLIYIIAFEGLVLGGTGYAVFVLGESGWWFLLALIVSGAAYKPQTWIHGKPAEYLGNAKETEQQGDALDAAYQERWDAELGRAAMRFVDRAGDVHPGVDDAETICAEFHAAMSAVIDRMPHVQRMNAANEDARATQKTGCV